MAASISEYVRSFYSSSLTKLMYSLYPHICRRCLKMRLHSSAAISNAVTEESAGLEVIRVPRKLAKKIENVKKEGGQLTWGGRVFSSKPGKEIISAKRKEFNHYMNQKYDKFNPPKLASHGWKHRKSKGDYFTILAHRSNPSYLGKQPDTDGIERKITFDEMPLHKSLKDALQRMRIDFPTQIQYTTIPSLLEGKNVLFAAETGSGKTLTYLLPVLNMLFKERETFDLQVLPKEPRAMILVPTRELATQVEQVARLLTTDEQLTIRHLEGSKSMKTKKHTFLTPVDVIISTPGPLLSCLREGFVSMKHIHHVVIDEVDTMLDSSFSYNILKIFKDVNICLGKWSHKYPPSEAQLVLVGATMPKHYAEILSEIIYEKSITVISTPQLHRVMPHVNQKFIRMPSQDKSVHILELAKRNDRRGIRTIIFCNEVDSCNWMSAFLQQHNIRVIRLNGKLLPEYRVGMLNAFHEGACNILIATDIASRGIDTINVRHVINFDFPHHMSDYIHRVGRVGRVGSHDNGHVTNFIVHKWDVDLVHKIERAVRQQLDLPNVNADITKKHQDRLSSTLMDDFM
ncbi:probable ATP-dependent RNA helicase DDX28 [Anneissia japonica]|uniref:probable ATP-dependent RNA helicase DDX28 n=1 Tax=Anneissia japonica TaxID=1529436 RepID=UPI0014257803|nr:probable ATP-dependent RNA helicase DDX28 [Anneissia japonica]